MQREPIKRTSLELAWSDYEALLAIAEHNRVSFAATVRAALHAYIEANPVPSKSS